MTGRGLIRKVRVTTQSKVVTIPLPDTDESGNPMSVRDAIGAVHTYMARLYGLPKHEVRCTPVNCTLED